MAWTVGLHSLTSAVVRRLNRGCWRHLLDNESTSVYWTLQLQHVWRHNISLALHHTSSPPAAAAAVVVVWMRSISTATSSTSHQWTRRTCLCVMLVPTDRRTSTWPHQTLYNSFSTTITARTFYSELKVCSGAVQNPCIRLSSWSLNIIELTLGNNINIQLQFLLICNSNYTCIHCSYSEEERVLLADGGTRWRLPHSRNSVSSGAVFCDMKWFHPVICIFQKSQQFILRYGITWLMFG